MFLKLGRRDPSRYTEGGVVGVLFEILCTCHWDTLVALGYHPSTTFISVTEATLLKYGLLLDVILFDNKLRTQISAFLEELMLNCCKRIKIQRDKTNKLIQFCFS